jgi:hypothetical protein
MTTKFFEPAGLKGGDWRQLEVEVTPEEVRARWEGQPLAPLTSSWVARSISRSIASSRRGNPAAAAWLPPLPGYASQGSLGLYVYRGSASFRNIVVEPLPGGR